MALTSKVPNNIITTSRRRGATISEIAREYGVSEGGVRAKARRMGAELAKEAALTVRQKAEKMDPEEGLQYALDALEQLEAELETVAPNGDKDRLTKFQRRIFDALASANGKFVTLESLFTRVYYDRLPQDYPNERTLCTIICHMRKRMPCGYQIETLYGQGYRLVSDAKD